MKTNSAQSSKAKYIPPPATLTKSKYGSFYRPTFSAYPSKGDGTLADKALAVALTTSVPGKRLFPWQQWALHQIFQTVTRIPQKVKLETFPGWTAKNVTLCVPRQNGKGDILENYGLALGLLFPGTRILHSAHLLETAEEAHARLTRRFEEVPVLKPYLRRSGQSNGRKAIYFNNKSVIEYRSRSDRSARGLPYDFLIMDEAMYLNQGQVDASLPTTSTKSHSQSVFAFTGLFDHSVYMHETRARALAGDTPGNWLWLEWAIPEKGDVTNEEWWRIVNPSTLDGLIPMAAIENEFANMAEEGFARERLNRHEPMRHEARAFSVNHWREIIDQESTIETDLTFSLYVAKNYSRGWVAATGRNKLGKIHIEIVQTQPGFEWIVPWLVDATKKHEPEHPLLVSGNRNDPAQLLIPQLLGEKIKVETVPGGLWFSACSFFEHQIQDNKVVAYETKELTESVLGAVKHETAGGFMWSLIDSRYPIGALNAVTLGVYGMARPGEVAKTDRPNFNKLYRQISVNKLSGSGVRNLPRKPKGLSW